MTSVKAKETKDDPKATDNIPDVLSDEVSGKQYLKGRFLGKGGFAKCYELTDKSNKEIWAGKIVSKALLIKQCRKDKMAQEIAVHRSLSHRHVVKFHTCFEDSNNVYILLELCRRRSLLELQNRRKAVTEPEARYFMKQITEACQYLHNNRIIHRDLKLANLFLNDNMEIKVGDFGLAAKLDFDGERKKTLCGTPNYMAPEVLGQKGHSYEVDVWSLGCILFTLLVGTPPFECPCVKRTYERIKKNEYNIPIKIGVQASNLINRLLMANPKDRPAMNEIILDPFFSSGYFPPHLPTSCLTMEPRFDTLVKELAQAGDAAASRKPLLEVNEGQTRPVTVEPGKLDLDGKCDKVVDSNLHAANIGLDTKGDEVAEKDYLSDLHSQLSFVMAAKLPTREWLQSDECEDPAAVPIYWISKWVDYSNKYGLGYQLCDNSYGMLFNDSTRLLLLSNLENMHYIESCGQEHYHGIHQFPENLTKKVKLLGHFRDYMDQHLLKAGGNIVPRDTDEMVRLPFLKTWLLTPEAIVLYLSNGTLQVNFYQNHTKAIICPLMSAVTFINSAQQFYTYRLSFLEKYGCPIDMTSHLIHVRTMVEKLLAARVTETSPPAQLVS